MHVTVVGMFYRLQFMIFLYYWHHCRRDVRGLEEEQL